MENIFTPEAINYITWFVVGIVFVILEVSVFAGIGLLFAGLGAITLASLLSFNIISGLSLSAQIAYFLVFTSVWAAALWYPLKKSLSKEPKDSYKEIIGTPAYVDHKNGLEASKVGFVKWSGTRMRAIIKEGAITQHIENGSQVWVHEIIDGNLVVDIHKPK
jgi:membrane protein implicated in regulation of membrane protease activity